MLREARAWLVCVQGPALGEGITNGGQRVALVAPDAACPDVEGTRLHPESPPTPTPAPPAPAPEPPKDDGNGGGGDTGASSGGGSSSGASGTSGGGRTSGGGGSSSGGGGTSGIQFGQACPPVGARATTSDGRPAKCFMGKGGRARWGYRS